MSEVNDKVVAEEVKENGEKGAKRPAPADETEKVNESFKKHKGEENGEEVVDEDEELLEEEQFEDEDELVEGEGEICDEEEDDEGEGEEGEEGGEEEEEEEEA